MSLFSSTIFTDDKESSNKFDFFEEESNNYNPLDNSFSLMSEDNKLKNPADLFESQSQLVNSKNNSDIDKECSPAPAPLRSSQSQIQTDLGASHNMECPEVVQETEGKINNDVMKIFPFKENEDDLVEKPFDQSLYYYLCSQQNLENSSNVESNNNSDLGDKSAAVNVINNNESMNSLLYKVTNLDINNSNNNNCLEEFYPAPKHNFEQAQTPMCAKNCKFKISTQNKKGNTFLFLKNTETKKNRNNIYRKLKPDSLRKKIKARLHKKLTKIINEKLKKAGSKCYFDMLPQSFITNINIGFNKPLLNLTMRELFQKTFGFKSKDKEKIEYNIRIMKYIEDNPDINNNSEVGDFLDSKYSEIIREYLDGDYLQEDIDRLKEENESEDYINRYNFIAMHWIEFYENGHI